MGLMFSLFAAICWIGAKQVEIRRDRTLAARPIDTTVDFSKPGKLIIPITKEHYAVNGIGLFLTTR